MSIKLSNVTYTYGIGTPFEKTALYDTDVEIHEGEFVGIIGHTGSGKSTLVQILNGLIKPTSGTVTVDGTDIGKKTKEAMAVRHKVGMVFQYPEYQLFEETIAKDIAFGPRNFGLSEEEITERVKEAMDFVGLDYKTYADRSPFRLSGGQMRRVAIAGVIAIHPSYLILDEPSAGLDPIGRREIFSEIQRWHQEKGITVILVSHNMDDISRLASRLPRPYRPRRRTAGHLCDSAAGPARCRRVRAACNGCPPISPGPGLCRRRPGTDGRRRGTGYF